MARIKYCDPKTNEWTYADSNVIDVSRSDEIYVLGDGETLEDAPTDAVMVISPDGYVDIPSSGGNVENATDEDVMDLLSELGAVTPITTSSGEILVNESGVIYSL